MKTNFFLVFIISFLFIQCQKDEEKQPVDEFEQAKLLWESKNIDSYAMTFQVSCFCIVDLTRPAQIVVIDNKIISVNEEVYDDTFLLYGAYKTISELFIHIEETRKENPVVEELAFDSIYGYPTLIFYDISLMMADEEIGYTISDFIPQ